MLYEGSDGNVHVLGDGEELKHYKYIKKIKTGSGWRYFYTPEELKAYYEGSKAANKAVNNILDKRDDYNTVRNIRRLENKKNQKQEQQAWKAYQEVGARGGTEKEAMRKAVKDVAKTELRYQVDKKKLEVKNDLTKKKRAASGDIKAATDTAKLAGKGVKNAADSVPRLEKHGNKYYIADKKTQKKIERSGAGGNVLRKKGKATGVYTLSDKTRNKAWSNEYKRRAKENQGSAFKKANELAKSSAYKGAAKGITPKYEKYEAKNVVNKKMSEIKNKASKGRSAVEKKLKKKTKK